jgi:HAD superfamily (subfamily IIIA) phosphatase, TIGR01668
MFKGFYPDEYVDSTYGIDFGRLYKEGYRGILFDIDNTLVPHGARADEAAIQFFEKIKAMGFVCCLISNNKLKRVKMFGDDIQVKFIEDAKKPSIKNYKKAMSLIGTNVDNTIFVGDQLFTDIYGAKRTGLRTILVKPINPKEEIQIVLKRYLEKIVLYFYEKEIKKNDKD